MIYRKLLPFFLSTVLLMGGCTGPARPLSSSSDLNGSSGLTPPISSASSAGEAAQEAERPPLQDAAAVSSPPLEAGRAPEIYAYNPESELYDRLPFEAPPNTLAELAIAAAGAQNTAVRLREITQQKGMIVVDFLPDAPPATGVGSGQESAVLDSIAQTILMNHQTAEWICYRVDGEPYASGHFSFGLEEQYTPTPLRLVAHTPEAYAALRADVPYPGLPTPEDAREQLLIPYEDSPLVRELTYFLSLVGPPKADAADAAELENDFILRQALYSTPLLHCYANMDMPDYTPALLPIALSAGDYEMYLREHVEAAAKALYGEGIALRHHDLSKWRWHETEGVYTPPHMSGGYPMAAVLGYEQAGSRYTVECAFVNLGMGGYFDDEGNAISEAELNNALQTRLPRREIVLERQPDGNLLFISHRFLT